MDFFWHTLTIKWAIIGYGYTAWYEVVLCGFREYLEIILGYLITILVDFIGIV